MGLFNNEEKERKKEIKKTKKLVDKAIGKFGLIKPQPRFLPIENLEIPFLGDTPVKRVAFLRDILYKEAEDGELKSENVESKIDYYLENLDEFTKKTHTLFTPEQLDTIEKNQSKKAEKESEINLEKQKTEILAKDVLTLDGTIKEFRAGFAGETKTDLLNCTAILEKNFIEIKKRSMVRGKPRGEKKILYRDIVTVDFDKTRRWSIDGVQIHVQGFVYTIQSNSNTAELFFENLVDKVNKSKQQGTDSKDSLADEIAKFHDLKEKGILTEEEFESKKKELLGL